MSRLRVLKAREEGVQKLLAQAHQRLSELTKDKEQYKKLLQDLIVQVSFTGSGIESDSLEGHDQAARAQGVSAVPATRLEPREVCGWGGQG